MVPLFYKCYFKLGDLPYDYSLNRAFLAQILYMGVVIPNPLATIGVGAFPLSIDLSNDVFLKKEPSAAEIDGWLPMVLRTVSSSPLMTGLC